jgi:hypothetical protein
MTHEFKTHRLIPSGYTTIEVPIYVEYETLNDNIEITGVTASDFRIQKVDGEFVKFPLTHQEQEDVDDFLSTIDWADFIDEASDDLDRNYEPWYIGI